MTHGKLNYNTDRWIAYWADRMTWHVAHLRSGTKAYGNGKLTAGPSVTAQPTRAATSGLQCAVFP